jgi:hypothetical protein
VIGNKTWTPFAVIRQVEVGKRVRLPFVRNLEMPIPDIEEVVHAIFDIVAGRPRDANAITVGEVAELAKRYSTATGKSEGQN